MDLGALAFGSAVLQFGADVAYPSALPQTNLQIALRADKGIKLGTTLKRVPGVSGSNVTLAALFGDLSNMPIPGVLTIKTGGVPGVATFDLSLDGGHTFPYRNIGTGTSFNPPGTNLVYSFSGSYTAGQRNVHTVESWTDQKSGFVFTTTSASTQPALITNGAGRLRLWFDGTDDFLICATAGVVSWVSGDDLPFTAFSAHRSASSTPFDTVWGAYGGTQARFDIAVNTGPLWALTKRGNVDASPTTRSSTVGSPTVAVDTTYVSEVVHTGTAVSLYVNGSGVTLSSSAMNAGTATDLANLTIGCTNINGAKANFHEMLLGELIIYSGDQHAAVSSFVTPYLMAQHTDPVSLLPADNKFHDVGAITSKLQNTGFTTQQAFFPNDAKFRSTIRSRLKFNPAGATSVDVKAITMPPTGGSPFTTIGVYIDNVYHSTLDYSSEPYMVKGTRTLTIPGGASLVELEENATLVEVPGVTLDTRVAPARRVMVRGDSSVDDYGTSVRSKGWVSRLRHALNQATYQLTALGLSGQALQDVAGNGTVRTTFVNDMLAKCDGTAKNIVVLEYGNNDFVQNVALATFQASYEALLALMFTTAASNSIPGFYVIVFSPIGSANEAATNGVGATIGNYRTRCANAVTTQSALNPGQIVHFDGGVNIPFVDADFYADDIHMGDPAHLTCMTAIKPYVEAA